MNELKASTPVSSTRLLGDWQDISTAPKDGTRFMGRVQSQNKTSENKRQTWWGKTSHVPIYGWCHGKVENVDLWNPTAWKPLKAKSPNDQAEPQPPITKDDL